MGYEWAAAVLDKLQGIEPHEVTQVLAAHRRWPRPAVGTGGLRVLTIWGRTRTGRALIVAVTRKDQWDWWIVGVRALSADEVSELEEWEARDE